LAETVGERRQEPPAADAWPLPAGARLVDVDDGQAVITDQIFNGPGISSAYERLSSCFRTYPAHGLDPATTVFLDTETTGLAGGTGTYVFLVGIGRFIGPAFHVRQLFMRHPGDERHVLTALERELVGQNGLVTYNGRTFDVPLLETRSRMHRRSLAVPANHVDLLSPARAIWKHRLPNCALGTIERAVLGTRRDIDASGWMIPQIYFDYLRTRQVDALIPVLEHNRTDIVSLARLTAIVHGYRTGLDSPTHDIDRVAVALMRLRAGLIDESVADLQTLWRRATIPADLRLRALRELSVAMKRQGRLCDAVEQWQVALTDPSRSVRFYAMEELAKYFEHAARDHEQALELAQRGADGAALAGDEVAVAAFARRLQRLERKVQRCAESAATSTSRTRRIGT
jgi:uncharacterized protein YprB with RNaseH-like and TPR domain